MRTILSLVCLLAVAGCSLPERRRPHRDDYDYDRHHRHYRAADDADKDKNAPEDGTPIPDDLKNPPAETQQPAQPSTTDALLAKIADQLAQQPTVMHHEFESMRQSLTGMQASFDQKLTGVPDRVKAEVVKALDQPPPPAKAPASEAKPNAANQTFGVHDPLDDEPSATPYGNYSGIRIQLDLRGTRRLTDGTLEPTNGRAPACVACMNLVNGLVREAVPAGWTVGFDRSKHFWLVQAVPRGGLDPTIEIVENGIVKTVYHGFNPPTIDKLMNEHPRSDRRQAGPGIKFPPEAPAVDGQYDEWQAWRNRSSQQPNCSAPQAYAAPNCSQPAVQYSAPNCSQPVNYGYQQAIPIQAYGQTTRCYNWAADQWQDRPPVQHIPTQQFYGGRTICTPQGCFTY
jgi:hypothetical protein